MTLHAKIGSPSFNQYAAEKRFESKNFTAHVAKPVSPVPCLNSEKQADINFINLLSYASTSSNIAYESPAA